MSTTSEYREEDLQDLLPLYYKRLFPQSAFYNWLTYGDPSKFERREISFTLFGDIYIRFLSFDSLETFVRTLHQKTPVKIDIGAIYKDTLKLKNTLSSFPVAEREVVFDIDLTDYDVVRSCCRGASVCPKCWKLMVIAVKVLDVALREDFGYRNILWLFSGRRGVHCWVSDRDARTLNDTERTALAEYLNYIKGGQNIRPVKLPHYNLHQSTVRALSIIDEYFVQVCVIDQDILGSDERLASFLSKIEQEIRPSFAEALTVPGRTSQERWAIFLDHFQRLQQKLPRSAKNLVEELKLCYCYPRLDMNVTMGSTHLLKAPFSVHPKTGKISVPFNPKVVENFDPNMVPTISQLVDEINTYDMKTQQQEKGLKEAMENQEETINVKIKDYKKTSLLKHVSVFNEFLRGIKASSSDHSSMMEL